MSASKRYLLDANVFIEAQQKYYARDICPGFWLGLVRLHQQQRVFSIDRVKTELSAGNDSLSQWAKETAPATFFKGTSDQAVVKIFRQVMTWVQGQSQFQQDTKAQFAAGADGWLVAYAKANDHLVVTHEEYSPDAKRRIPIPNICLAFDVTYMNTFEMLRALKVQFVLRKRRART